MENIPDQDSTGRYPFRVFISYSHEDRHLVEKMVGVLKELGLHPLWDRDIHPGTPFTDAIKDLIGRSHLFIPIITKNAQERPWVHQETGYALAINIPILPIAIEGEDLPDDIIAQLQAIVVRSELEDLRERLQEINLERLIIPSPRKPHAIVEVADWPETRAELMLRYLYWVTDLDVCGWVRHRAGASTFSIPDRDINDPIWKARDGVYDGKPPRSDYFHSLQREERRALERHVLGCGGCLMIGKPEVISEDRVHSQDVRAWKASENSLTR